MPTAQVANYLADSLLVGEAEQSIVQRITKPKNRDQDTGTTRPLSMLHSTRRGTLKCLERCAGLAASNGADRWPVSGRLRLRRRRSSQVNGLRTTTGGRQRRHGRTLYPLRAVPACDKVKADDTRKWRNKMTRPHTEKVKEPVPISGGQGDNLRWKSWTVENKSSHTHTLLAAMIQVECGC